MYVPFSLGLAQILNRWAPAAPARMQACHNGPAVRTTARLAQTLVLLTCHRDHKRRDAATVGILT